MSLSRGGQELGAPQTRPLSRSKASNKTLGKAVSRSHQTGDALGQFSFGPATQTTVVTTTTTTTTKFPPFLVRAPRRSHQLDPKLYPLAATPTPPSLKRICFVHDGKPAVFREASDTSLALEEHQEEQEILRRGYGLVQNVQHFDPHSMVEIKDQRRRSARIESDRPASPESIEDNEDISLGRSESPAQSNHSWISNRKSAVTERGLRFNRHLREAHPTNPHTPDTQRGIARALPRRSDRFPADQPSNLHLVLPSPDTEQQLSMVEDRGTSPLWRQDSGESYVMAPSRMGSTSRTTTSRSSHDTIVPTPPIEPEYGQPSGKVLSARALSSVPARLYVAASPSAQEGNLPSPSLSPVTAAVNAQNASYFTDIETNSDVTSQHTHSVRMEDAAFEETPSHNRYGSPAATDTDDLEDTWLEESDFSTSSIAEIPAMLDFFETLPDELKSYVMHQLLRRCPKPTLHVVAEAVNPALRCDFLSILPPELGLNILSYLDVKSLCRASQVSRKWRQMANSDEKAWKELFDRDGFSLPQGELQSAITQGWGWQDPYGIFGYEKDISCGASVKSESEAGSPKSVATARTKKGVAVITRRSKRKAAALLSSRNKQAKRQDTSREVSADIDSIDWQAQMSTAEGPYNAANAAILAVPDPKLLVPALKGLHLYKSLYRRHHLIRRNWMMEETKPRHIAFRAHDSHVVTCLQFDTDKILTGSDDNNINVYDTKTGALRQLLRGHEGGVWALQYEGNTLVSGSTDRSVRVWDIEHGIETQVFRGHTSTVRCLQIVTPSKVGETAEGKSVMMPKHALIITGSRDSTLRVWKLPRPGDPMFIQAESDAEFDDCPYFVRTLTGHQHSVRAIAAHADTLVSGSYDCTVRVWKISTGETIHRLQGHSQKVYSVILDHTRNRCISGSMDNLVKIWNLDTGSVLHTLEGHSSLVGLLDLNNDRLVSAAADSTLRIWDPENGQCKATLSAHTGAITCFQHDGQKVISGSDRTLKMWNIKTGECMKDLLSDLSGVWQVKFNERRCVAAVQRDNMTYIEVLDFGASRDGITHSQLGRRIVVDIEGRESEAIPDEAPFFE